MPRQKKAISQPDLNPVLEQTPKELGPQNNPGVTIHNKKTYISFDSRDLVSEVSAREIANLLRLMRLSCRVVTGCAGEGPGSPKGVTEAAFAIEIDGDDQDMVAYIEAFISNGYALSWKNPDKARRKQRSTQRERRYKSLCEELPELAAQWHPTQNGEMTPDKVAPHSSKKVWWLCPDCGYEWQAVVGRRAAGTGCPSCLPEKRRRALIAERGSLLDNDPSLAAQWHPTKNGSLTPDQVTQKSSKKVWWLCPGCGHEWQAAVGSRSAGAGCPSCWTERYRMALMAERGSLLDNDPGLAAQWHPTKNATLTPDQVSCGLRQRVWWKGPCGHEWEASIQQRVYYKTGCPYCGKTNRRAKQGENDLATLNPALSLQWHPTKNEGLSPAAVTPGSHKMAWWVCPACGHEWKARIGNRTKGSGCPMCGHKPPSC